MKHDSAAYNTSTTQTGACLRVTTLRMSDAALIRYSRRRSTRIATFSTRLGTCIARTATCQAMLLCADAAFGANEPVIRSCRRVDLAYTMLEVASIWLVGGDVAAKISVV